MPPLFPTVDLQSLGLKSAKNLVLKTIQENFSNGTPHIKFIAREADQEIFHNNFPKWMTDPTIKNFIKSYEKNDGSYMVSLRTSDEYVAFQNINGLQEKALDNDADEQTTSESMNFDNDKDGGQDAKAALKRLKRSAGYVDVNAQLMIANRLREGKDVSKNSENETEASELILKASANDNPVAQYNVGLMYLEGNGVTRDVEEAFRWLRKSASRGYSEAQLTIGNLLYEGKIFEQDIKTATKLYRLAAKQNNIHAQMIMGEMYIREQNYKKALKWIKMTAEQENPDAQFMLGQMYAKGKGVKQDYVEAIRWFKKSAEQGHYEAGIVAEALTN
jgi:TPR repeat protein